MSGSDRRESGTASLESSHATIRFALLAAVVALAVYAPTLRHGFLFDDIPWLLDNPWLRDWRSLTTIFTSDSWMHQGKVSGYYRPIVHTVYLVLYQLFGPNPVAFHATVVFLHALNTALVVLVVRRAQAKSDFCNDTKPGLALVAGLVFAVHPANTAVVAWVQGSDNLLFTFFGLGALLAHDRENRWAGMVAAAALLLAALTRETALVFFPLLICYDLVTARPSLLAVLRSRLPRYGMYALVLAGYLALRSKALGGLLPAASATGFDWQSLFLNGPVLLALNLRTLAVPFPLAVWPDYSPVQDLTDVRFVMSLAALGLLACAAARLARRSPLGLLGLAFTLLPLSLVLYLPAMGYALGNHRLYVPSAGLGVLLAIGLFSERRASSSLARHRTGVAVLLVASLAAWTMSWTPVYHDGLSFWRRAVLDSPGRWMPHIQLGIALVAADRLEEGVAELKRAQAIDPSDPLTHYHLAGVHARQGRPDLADAEYRAALAVAPAHVPSLSDLAQLELNAGRDREALALLRKAAAIAPGHPWVRDRLGAALFLNGHVEEGIAELRAAAELAPWDARIRGHLEQARAEAATRTGARP